MAVQRLPFERARYYTRRFPRVSSALFALGSPRSAIRDMTDMRLANSPCALWILDRQRLLQRLQSAGVYENQRAAAEACAHHARAVDAFGVAGDLDDGVQFTRADFVVVAQTRVRGVEQLAQRF